MPSTKFRPFERQKSSGADLAIAQRRCDLLRRFRLNLYHRPINERRLRASPFNPFGVERNYIPEYASVTATAWLRCGQLLIQLSDNKVARVPELDNPKVCNPRKNRSRRPAPIRCQNRFPDHQNCQAHRPLLFQQLFDCGGPRKQSGHVGDSKSTKWTFSAVWLCVQAMDAYCGRSGTRAANKFNLADCPGKNWLDG
jgi:hypothetical protein